MTFPSTTSRLPTMVSPLSRTSSPRPIAGHRPLPPRLPHDVDRGVRRRTLRAATDCRPDSSNLRLAAGLSDRRTVRRWLLTIREDHPFVVHREGVAFDRADCGAAASPHHGESWAHSQRRHGRRRFPDATGSVTTAQRRTQNEGHRSGGLTRATDVAGARMRRVSRADGSLPRGG